MSDSNLLPQEAYDYFYKRTDEHILRVRRNLYLWTLVYPELTEELLSRGDVHDLSKVKEPERTPYIWRTWKGYCDKNNLPFTYPHDMEQQTRDAIFHHITHNRHHPEWHPDPDEMTKVDLIEMVSDWKAMSQEFGEESPLLFAKKVLGRRFQFSTGRCADIIGMIYRIDALCIENQNLEYIPRN